jgi:hypothetical protein
MGRFGESAYPEVMATTTERLRAAHIKIDEARDRVQADSAASPVLVAVVNEFAMKAAKAAAAADERTAVIELEQAGDSAKAAAEADTAVSDAARQAVIDAHMAICIAKGKL